MCHDFKLHKIFRLSMESVYIFKCVSRFGQNNVGSGFKNASSFMLLCKKRLRLLLWPFCNRNESNMQTVKLFE